MTKLQRTLGGMRRMRRLPGAMFVIDPQREHIAVVEARKLEIPVIGTGDTNVDPDMLDYVIPANDDAIRAIRLLCTLIADAARRGRARSVRHGRSTSRWPSSRSRKRRATRWSPRSPRAARSASSPSPTRRSCCRPRHRRRGRGDRGTSVVPAPRRRGSCWPACRRVGVPPPKSEGGRPSDRLHQSSNQDAISRETMAQTTISAATVKELRELTGAGFMDCKRALEDAAGDVPKAVVAAA